MKTKLLQKGYARETYMVEAEEGEELTKEKLEKIYGFPFGCHVTGGNGRFFVDSYTD